MADAPGDSLQQRIAKFIDETKAARATNGTSEFCIGTTVGLTRRQNQDRTIIVLAEYSNAPERNFLLGVVADGMGGLIDGDKAATIAVSVFVSKVIRASSESIVQRLRQAAFAANEAVFRAFRGRGGTTLSAMFVSHDVRAVGVNIGDSRIYGITKYRDLKQLSRDDTLGRMLGTKQVDPSQKDRLVQFVGIGEGMEPHIVSAERATFNSLLMSTDGIHGSLPEAIAPLVRLQITNLDLANRLVSLGDLIGHDNGTALIMPIQLSYPTEPSPLGITLKFWSAFDKIEIWIPGNVGEPLLYSAANEQQKISAAKLDDSPTQTRQGQLVHKQKKKTMQKRSTGRQKKKKATEQGDAWLPIEDVETPPLDISFPEKRRR